MSNPFASSPFDPWLAGDPEVSRLLGEEAERQSTTLQLIASENFTSPAVLAASGSILTNKYAEGYPGRRYYGGNQVIDEVENLARDRAKALFGAEHANVQPHAGAIADSVGAAQEGAAELGIAFGQDHVIFVSERGRKAANEIEQAMAPRPNMRTVLNVHCRPVLLGCEVVAFVEKRVEPFQNKPFVFFTRIAHVNFPSVNEKSCSIPATRQKT